MHHNNRENFSKIRLEKRGKVSVEKKKQESVNSDISSGLEATNVAARICIPNDDDDDGWARLSLRTFRAEPGNQPVHRPQHRGHPGLQRGHHLPPVSLLHRDTERPGPQRECYCDPEEEKSLHWQLWQWVDFFLFVCLISDNNIWRIYWLITFFFFFSY